MIEQIGSSFKDVDPMELGKIKRFWDFLVSLVTKCGYCGVYSVQDYLKKVKSKFQFKSKDYIQIAKQFNQAYERFIDYGPKGNIEKMKKEIKENKMK